MGSRDASGLRTWTIEGLGSRNSNTENSTLLNWELVGSRQQREEMRPEQSDGTRMMWIDGDVRRHSG